MAWNKDKYRQREVYLYYRYRDMKARVNGKCAGDGKSQLWLGLPLMSKEEFVAWALNDPGFEAVYNAWAAAGYPRRLAPTAHRIDRSDGYVSGNIKWVPHGEKSRQHLAQGTKTLKARRASANSSRCRQHALQLR